jgi:hypothetical protein
MLPMKYPRKSHSTHSVTYAMMDAKQSASQEFVQRLVSNLLLVSPCFPSIFGVKKRQVKHISEYKLNAPARPVKASPKIRGIRK